MKLVKTIGKWYVYVSEWDGSWIAQTMTEEEAGKLTIDDQHTEVQKLEAPTLPQIEELIKRQTSDDRHFKPIEVIRASDNTVGRITSRVADSRRDEVYYTWKPSPESKAQRSSVSLSGYSYRYDKPDYALFKATPENLKVLEIVKKLEADARALERQADELKKTYADPITPKMVGVD